MVSDNQRTVDTYCLFFYQVRVRVRNLLNVLSSTNLSLNFEKSLEKLKKILMWYPAFTHQIHEETQILLWSQVHFMLSLASSLEAKPKLGLIFLAETSHCYLALKRKKKKRRKKEKKEKEAEKKEVINKTANENRGKVLEATVRGRLETNSEEAVGGLREPDS